MGHVRDLPRSQFGVDIEQGFTPKYITVRGQGKVLQELRKAVKSATRSTWPRTLTAKGRPFPGTWPRCSTSIPRAPNRIEFNEITKSAVQAALKNPRPIDHHRVDAQQARRILDRLVGYKLSPLLWSKVKRGLSAGRVQSVALRLICDREQEIDDFVQEEYWTITARSARRRRRPPAKPSKPSCTGSAARSWTLKDEAEARDVVEQLSRRRVCGGRGDPQRAPPQPGAAVHHQHACSRRPRGGWALPPADHERSRSSSTRASTSATRAPSV